MYSHYFSLGGHQETLLFLGLGCFLLFHKILERIALATVARIRRAEKFLDCIEHDWSGEPSGQVAANFQLQDVFHVKRVGGSGCQGGGKDVRLGPSMAFPVREQVVVVLFHFYTPNNRGTAIKVLNTTESQLFARANAESRLCLTIANTQFAAIAELAPPHGSVG